MANVIIKRDGRREHDAFVLDSFKKSGARPEDRDAAEIIAARTREVMSEIKRRESGRR